jgi:hypothetical protein
MFVYQYQDRLKLASLLNQLQTLQSQTTVRAQSYVRAFCAPEEDASQEAFRLGLEIFGGEISQ